MNGWALSDVVIEMMVQRLDQLGPSLILECGSGVSSVHLARWASNNDAVVISLEHKREYYEQTKKLVGDLPIDLRLAPLRGGFYDTSVPDGVDFALVDGPPGHGIGRSKVLPVLWPHLAPDFEMWLDDANRAHEQSCIASWVESYPIDVRLNIDDKGLAIIRRA